MSYLKLSRKVNERVFVNDAITVTVLRIQGDRVHLGFSAPEHVPIDREEIAIRKRQNQPLAPPKAFIFDKFFKGRGNHAVI